MAAAMIASVIPFVRSYGLPYGWSPRISELFTLARRNVPLAGADAIEWATRNVDRFILGLLFEPRIVGIYFMAQQVSSLPQKLKTSFEPVLGPVISRSLADDNRSEEHTYELQSLMSISSAVFFFKKNKNIRTPY